MAQPELVDIVFFRPHNVFDQPSTPEGALLRVDVRIPRAAAERELANLSITGAQNHLGAEPLVISDRSAAELPTEAVLPQGAKVVIVNDATLAASILAQLAGSAHMQKLGARTTTTVLNPTTSPLDSADIASQPAAASINPAISNRPAFVNLIFVVSENAGEPLPVVRLDVRIAVPILDKTLGTLGIELATVRAIQNQIAGQPNNPLIISDRNFPQIPLHLNVPINYPLITTPEARRVAGEVNRYNVPAVHPALQESLTHINEIMGTVCNGMPSDQRIWWQIDEGMARNGEPNGTGEPSLRTGYMPRDFREVLRSLLQDIPAVTADKGEGREFLLIRQSALLSAGGVEAIAAGVRHIQSITLCDYAGARSDRPDIKQALIVLNNALPRMLGSTNRETGNPRWIYDRGLPDSDNPSLRLDGLTTYAQAGGIVDILKEARVTASVGRGTDGGPVVLIQGWRHMAQVLQYTDGVAQDIERHLAATTQAEKRPGFLGRLIQSAKAHA